ncbi:MAG: hypothetical protein FWG64_10220 [Firmicutes bacterium]|nr:hypothetical protein [Bacillota bacterium]
MDWESDLVKRSCLVLKDLAFETFFNEEIGKDCVLVTNCLNMTQKALYVKDRDTLFQKLSTFEVGKSTSDLDRLIKNNAYYLVERIE